MLCYHFHKTAWQIQTLQFYFGLENIDYITDVHLDSIFIKTFCFIKRGGFFF